MFVIGITGGIGCGKSTVADICRKEGLQVIDADELSREATAANGSAMPEIIEKFGRQCIDEHGALDREKMAKKVFANHRALDELSAIVHRHVIESMVKAVEALDKKKVKAVALDVPIPVRHGFVDICNQIWVVWASDEHRIERLSKRGMTEAEARRRMAMQMTREEYTNLADHVIENDADLDALEKQVAKLLETELGQRGIRLEAPVEEED